MEVSADDLSAAREAALTIFDRYEVFLVLFAPHQSPCQFRDAVARATTVLGIAAIEQHVETALAEADRATQALSESLLYFMARAMQADQREPYRFDGGVFLTTHELAKSVARTLRIFLSIGWCQSALHDDDAYDRAVEWLWRPFVEMADDQREFLPIVERAKHLDVTPWFSGCRASIQQESITAETWLERRTGNDPLEATASALTPSEARAKFCFDEWDAGKTYKEINSQLRRHPEWEGFDDEREVRGPINSWAKRIGVAPRKGRPGRQPAT